ncbi:MAG: hypothetical protein IPI67_24135 [Myxococcales bacterium]|nr:hypothetical protein [Myxococcales bacterium]
MHLGRSKLFHAVVLAGLSLGAAACGGEDASPGGGTGGSTAGGGGAGGVSAGGTGGGASGGGAGLGASGGAAGSAGAAGAAGGAGTAGATGTDAGVAEDAATDAHDFDAGDGGDGWHPTK